MKGDFEINIQERVFIVVGSILIGLLALYAAYIHLTPTLSNTVQARASLTAHTLAFYLGSLSSADAGTVEKNLNDIYVVQIGKYSDLSIFFKKRPVSNYYIKVLLYDEKGKLLAESEEVSFIADIGCSFKGGSSTKPSGGGGASGSVSGMVISGAAAAAGASDENLCVATEKIGFITFTREAGRPITITGFQTAEGSGFTHCPRVSEDDIKNYVERYSAQHKVEKAFILAVMGAESYMQHCDDGFVKSSKDEYGNPIAFGLMQVIPSTARGLESEFKKMFNVDAAFNVEDPEQNVHAGVFMLSIMLKKYEGYDNQKELAMATYNCNGVSQAVAKYCSDKKGCWEKIKPYLGEGKEYCPKSKNIEDETTGKVTTETVVYVERIMRLYKCFDGCLNLQEECYNMNPCKSKWNA